MVGKAIGGGTFAGAKTPAPKQLARVADKFIYHSGTVDQLDNMKWGLEPQHGDWIHELAQHAGDIEPDELLEQSTPLVWMSDKPSWVSAKVARKLKKHPHDVTDDEIRQHGHVAMVPRKGDHAEHVWHVGEEGLSNGEYSPVTNLKGETKKAGRTDLYQNDWSGNKQPFGVERNEYVSAQPVEPMFHLTGQDLVDFLHASGNRPVKADGGEVDDPGITAYHGSPHDFERFDTSKIGTGEGNQSYGHGLYFAQNEDVAKGYRDTLGGHVPGDVLINGEKYPHWASRDVVNAYRKMGYDNDTAVMASHFLKEHKGDLNAAQGATWSNDKIPDSVSEALLRTEYATPAGHMYQVNINAHPDHFLDWDKPFHAQSEHVKRSLRNVPEFDDRVARYGVLDPEYKSKISMGEFIKRGVLPHSYDLSSPNFSKAYHEAGIKGIKYLDQGSRWGDKKEPTHNYVVFDDKLLNVKRKYAKGGIVQGGPPIHALHLTSKFGNSLPSAVNQAKAATRRRP